MIEQDRIAVQQTPICARNSARVNGDWWVYLETARTLEQQRNYLMEVLDELAKSSWYGERTRKRCLEELSVIRSMQHA